MTLKQFFVIFIVFFVLGNVLNANAEEPKTADDANPYLIQPGDILEVTVWKEKELQKEVLIRPDGGMSFPLVGDFNARGLSLFQIQELIAERLEKYIPNPVVTVSALKLLGNKIFVLGKVNKPGEYVANSYVDVMQALAMAGGMTPFSAVNEIKIIRRNADGIEQAVPFKYGEVEAGEHLKQNIILQSGDIIVVP